MGKTYRYQPSKNDEDRRTGRKEKRERTNNKRIGQMNGFEDPFIELYDEDYDDTYLDR